MEQPAPFREQLLDLVRRLPVGRVVTYGQLARLLGRPRNARLVGSVLSSLTPEDGPVPWHRVVNHRGGVSARADIFGFQDPVEEQRERLLAEGLEHDVKGRFSLSHYGLSDQEVRALFPTEMLVLVDLENRPVGAAPRALVRRENLLHRGVGILCWNSARELYVHRRTAVKDVFPSYYDMMVGGAMEVGEEYEEAAIREVTEELGVGDVEPDFLLETLYDGPRNRSWIQLFQVTWDGPIRWQEEEICWGRWMPFEEVLTWIEEVKIVPDGLHVFREYLRRR